MGKMLFIHHEQKRHPAFLQKLKSKLHVCEASNVDAGLNLMNRIIFDIFLIVVNSETEQFVWHVIREIERSHSAFTPVIFVGHDLSEELKTKISQEGWHWFSDFSAHDAFFNAVDKNLLIVNFLEKKQFTLEHVSHSCTYFVKDVVTIERIYDRTIQVNTIHSQTTEQENIFHFDAPLESFPKKYQIHLHLIPARSTLLVNQMYVESFDPKTRLLTMTTGKTYSVTAKYKHLFMWAVKKKGE